MSDQAVAALAAKLVSEILSVRDHLAASPGGDAVRIGTMTGTCRAEGDHPELFRPLVTIVAAGVKARPVAVREAGQFQSAKAALKVSKEAVTVASRHLGQPITWVSTD